MKKGFSLLELMLVAVIFSFVFVMSFMLMNSHDRNWRLGQDKLAEQQEARRAIDSMSSLLRQSSHDWVVDSVHYPVTITSNNRIDFYRPVFDSDGAITSLEKITFKLNPNNASQLLKKEALANEIVIANNVESIVFTGGCPGCGAFNCPNVSSDCPVVAIQIRTVKNAGFDLHSKVTLRNANIALPDDTEIVQPEEGEF